MTPANNQLLNLDIVGSCVSVKYELYQYHDGTLQGESFHWNLNFAILLTAINLMADNYIIFRKLSMITYITEIQKTKLADIEFPEVDQAEPGC